MAEPHLDHPGEVVWYAGKGPVPMAGPCPHDCQHVGLSTLAEGPDFEHYTLTVCNDPEGCAGQCRGWFAEYPPPNDDERPRYRVHSFRQVAG